MILSGFPVIANCLIAILSQADVGTQLFSIPIAKELKRVGSVVFQHNGGYGQHMMEDNIARSKMMVPFLTLQHRTIWVSVSASASNPIQLA